MTTALSKKTSQQEPPDSNVIMSDEIVRLETATEAMMLYVGYLSTQILNEQDQPSPNLLRISALEEQLDTVFQERQQMRPDNVKLIARALYVYSPIVKALYNK